MHHPIDSAIAFILLVGIVSGSFVYVYATLPPEGYIGISGTDVTPAIAQQMHLGSARGFLIVQVEPASPADKAGIKGGDRVVQLGGQSVLIGGDVVIIANGQSISGAKDLVAALKDKNIGDKIDFTLISGGNETKSTSLTVEPKPRSLFQ